MECYIRIKEEDKNDDKRRIAKLTGTTKRKIS